MILHLTEATYLAAAVLFILALRWLNHPRTARRGVAAGVAGMTAAIAGTLLHPGIVSFSWIAVACVVGTAAGVPLSLVPLTAVPQRTALSHSFGGIAAGLVGTAKYLLWLPEGELTPFRTAAISVEVILGFLTFTGSLMAAGKLQEVIPTRPITYKGQNVVNLSLLGIAVASAVILVARPNLWPLFPLIIVLSLVFGVLLILPIGGAAMLQRRWPKAVADQSRCEAAARYGAAARSRAPSPDPAAQAAGGGAARRWRISSTAIGMSEMTTIAIATREKFCFTTGISPKRYPPPAQTSTQMTPPVTL